MDGKTASHFQQCIDVKNSGDKSLKQDLSFNTTFTTLPRRFPIPVKHELLGSDWLVVGLSSWSGGTGWCATAIFFDFHLSALYPMILVTLCVILYTRQHNSSHQTN